MSRRPGLFRLAVAVEGRWRSPSLPKRGLALLITIATTVAAASPTEPPDAPWWLTARRADATLVARSRLRDGDTFVLRYRNSLYRSLAEEWFVVRDGRLVLVSLAADELAVLEEYYEIAGRARRVRPDGRRLWSAIPGRPLSVAELHIAATDLGRRTLVVPGSADVELWRAVDDDRPTVTLRLEATDR